MQRVATREVNSRKPDGSRRTRPVIILVVWLVLSLISATQRYADNLQTSPQTKFSPLFFWSLVIWSYWAFAAPLIFRLGRRVPLSGQNWAKAVPTHFLLAVLFGLLHIAFFALLGAFFGSTRSGVPPKFGDEFARALRILLYVELVLYWALLGAGIAQDSYRRYRERELKAKELETRLGLAQLQALKMQIQPHFLFNALNTIAMLIRNRENDQAVKMVAGLGELLRLSLDDNSAQEVLLSSELDFIRRYLTIEQFRFPDRLRVEIDVPEELLTAEVPNLVLQPLVENAIRHGVARSTSAGFVRIAAKRENGWLELSVQDDGVGFPRDWRGDENQGIGLKNTRVRLEQLYGDRQELIIQHAEPTGAIVRLRIPFHRQSEAVTEWKRSEL